MKKITRVNVAVNIQPLLAMLCPTIEMFRVAFVTWQLWQDVIYTKVFKCDTAGQRLNPATSDNSGFLKGCVDCGDAGKNDVSICSL